MPSPTIAIACAINRSYVLPLAVLLESLKQHLRPNFQPVLYLIHAGIPAADLAAISSRVETRCIVPTEAQLATLPRDPHFPPEASIPLLLPELLPAGLERVLFLDADMLVLDDLAILWDTPLDRCLLAAAPDAAVPFCSAPRGVKNWEALGIPAAAPYFNAGALLIDLPRWRASDLTRRVLQYFESTRERIDFLHQEALNAVLWNDWKQLDSRWNLLASMAGRSYAPRASEAWRHPGIVHFAGRMKPWRAPIGGPFNAPYQKALQQVYPALRAEPPNLQDRLHSVYDRYFRAAFYPIEQYLWRQRLL